MLKLHDHQNLIALKFVFKFSSTHQWVEKFLLVRSGAIVGRGRHSLISEADIHLLQRQTVTYFRGRHSVTSEADIHILQRQAFTYFRSRHSLNSEADIHRSHRF